MLPVSVDGGKFTPPPTRPAGSTFSLQQAKRIPSFTPWRKMGPVQRSHPSNPTCYKHSKTLRFHAGTSEAMGGATGTAIAWPRTGAQKAPNTPIVKPGRENFRVGEVSTGGNSRPKVCPPTQPLERRTNIQLVHAISS